MRRGNHRGILEKVRDESCGDEGQNDFRVGVDFHSLDGLQKEGELAASHGFEP